MRCATTCKPTRASTWATRMPCWCWTRPASSRRAPSRPACSGSTRARRGGSRTARSASSWATPAATGTPFSTPRSPCPRRGPGTRAGAAGRAGPRGGALSPKPHPVLPFLGGGRRRRGGARVPEAVAFTTKPKPGLLMLERARAAGVPFSWVVGGSVYGADHAIRRWAERHRRGYVLAVTSGQRLGLRPATTWIRQLPRSAWRRLSAGDGAKGPRLYDWACVPCSGAARGFRGALLVRRSIAKPTELAFYLTHAPEGTALAELVRVAGARWSIENLFERAKGEVGSDHCEVRSWVGWHRHTTLAMLALAYLAAVRKAAGAGGCGPRGPRRRPAAIHGARGPAPALAPGLDASARTGHHLALVSVAPPAPAARASRPLAPTDALIGALT